jgi:hypothetical protein
VSARPWLANGGAPGAGFRLRLSRCAQPQHVGLLGALVMFGAGLEPHAPKHEKDLRWLLLDLGDETLEIDFFFSYVFDLLWA